MQEYTIAPNRVRLLALILAMIGLIAYSNCYDGLFVFDDEYTLEEFDPGVGFFTQAKAFFLHKGAPCCGRPPISLAHAINHSLHGKDLWGYHALNVAVHLSAAMLLFGLARRTLQRIHLPEAHALYLAFAIAAVWIVHPINTSSVTYIGQRAESIMGLLFIGTFYLLAREKYKSAIVCAWVCVSAKEVGAMIPFVFAFYDRAFLSSTWKEVWKKHAWVYLSLLASWLMIPLLLTLAAGPKGNTVQFVYQMINPFTYLMTSANAIILYLKLIFVPKPLILDYGWPIAVSFKEYRIGLAMTLCLFGGTIWAVIRRPRLGFLGAAFFLILAPTTSVLPIISEIMAEHRMYVPAAVVIAYLVYGGYLLATRWNMLRAACGLLAVIVIALTWRTLDQNTYYHDKPTLWEYNSRYTPNNRRSWYNLGVSLDAQNRRAEAIPAYLQAIRCSPDWEAPRRNLGSAYMDFGRYEEAEQQFLAAMEFEPKEADNYLFMGQLQFYMGRPEKGFRYFQTAMDLEPGAPRIHKGFALGFLMVDDVNNALPNIAKYLSEPGINARVVNEAIQFCRDLNKLPLAEHIYRMGVQTGVLVPPANAPAAP